MSTEVTLLSSNEEKRVRLRFYFYMLNNSTLSTDVAKTNDIRIVVSEEIYVKRLIDSGLDEPTERVVSQLPSIYTGVSVPIYTQVLESDDSTYNLDSIIKSFISKFPKKVSFSRYFELVLQNPNEFPSYAISSDTLTSIFETFSEVCLSMGSTTEAYVFPELSFSNDKVTLKDISAKFTKTQFYGKQYIYLENCIFNSGDPTTDTFVAFSSGNFIKTSYIKLNSDIYVRLSVATTSQADYSSSYITMNNTTINFDDNKKKELVTEPLIKVSGANTINVSTLNVNYDLPYYRILQVDSCNTFTILEYIHKRTNKAVYQDFILSKFIDGKIVDSTIYGASSAPQTKTMCAILFKDMRSDASLIINNLILKYMGLYNAVFSDFNTLKCLGCTITDSDFFSNQSSVNINNLNFTDCKILAIKEMDITGKNINISSSTFKITNSLTVDVLIGGDFKVSSSNLFSNKVSYSFKENSSCLFTNVVNDVKESISFLTNRSSNASQTESITFNNTKFSGTEFSMTDFAKLTCSNTVLSKLRSVTFKTVSKVLNNGLTIDYNKLINTKVTFDGCTISTNKLDLSDVTSSFETIFNSCTGKTEFTYANELSSIVKHKLTLNSSTMDCLASYKYGIGGDVSCYLESNKSLGSRFIAEITMKISPVLTSEDRKHFAIASAVDSVDAGSVLYASFSTNDTNLS